MMRLMLMDVVLIFVLSMSLVAQENCDTGLSSRLAIDGYGRVTEGDANNVRNAANRSGTLIGQIEAGTPFHVMDGPVCTSSLTWWEIEYFAENEMVRGWTVESNSSDYFLEPITDERFVLIQNVSFSLPEGFDPGEMETELHIFNEIPAVIITFPEYKELGVGLAAEIQVLPSDAGDNGNDFEDMWEGNFIFAIEQLTSLLDSAPDLTAYDRDLPDFSPGVANLTFAQRSYLDFGTGQGYRFLTAYAQAAWSVSNDNLRYRYQGLTEDGSYFVDVTFAVDAPEDPPALDLNNEALHAGYGEKVAQFYDAMPPESFTPSLLELDALIASLEVH